ncbi:MAG: flagellar biosynthetic protein FliR [Parachlamydiaceae bacterium]|nr:flagellar biosynthetic protein FliR [Parachlamydiaceae bacterium]
MEPTPDGTYLYLFLTSAFDKENPLAVLSLLLLFLARFLPIISLSPFFGSRVMPHPVKVTFGLSMFVIFLPQLLTVTTTPIGFTPFTVVLLIKEVFIGLIIGFIIGVPFVIAQNAGIIIDHQRGGASLMVNDPTIQNQSSPLGTLFNMVLIFIFFYIEGPFILLNAIITSYDVIPPDRMINTHFFDKNSEFWVMMIQLFNQVMVISMQLAAPGLLAILMTDVFLGIANRLAPQVQITFLGMPLKSLLALTVVCFGWRLFSEELIKQCYKWLEATKQALLLIAISEN